MDKLISMFGDMDFSGLVPDIGTFMGKLELIARLCVMTGPLVLLGLGLWFLLWPPKDNKSYVGFRTFHRAKTVESWRYAQHIAGCVWGAMGVVLTLILSLICNGFRKMDGLTMGTVAIVCVVLELILLIVSIVIINKQVAKKFDKDGIALRSAVKESAK